MASYEETTTVTTVTKLTAAVALLVFVAGCAVTPSRKDLEQPAIMLSVIGTPPVIDMRAPFRTLFCAVLSQRDPDQSADGCDEFLWRLPDEKTGAAQPRAPGPLDPRLSILIVGGAFSDCFPPQSTAFVQSVAELRARGVYVDYAEVSGRSSSEANSKTIAEHIAAAPRTPGHPLILIGHSKGTADILEALATHDEAAARVSAVISFAGAVNGSPLAGRYLGLYSHYLSERAIGQCPTGDGGVLDSLTRAERLNWFADNHLPPNIRYYSLGAFTTPPRLARALGYPQRHLSKIDTRNDGLLLIEDQLIPGSELLGYANADHWAIAMRMEDRFPYLAHRSVGPYHYPQEALFEAALLFVQDELGLSGH